MNVYIDCGTHLGQGIEAHINVWNIDQTWKIFGFEANPFTFTELLELKKLKTHAWHTWPLVEVFNLAVWNENKEMDFGCSTYEFDKNSMINVNVLNFINEHPNLISKDQLNEETFVMANKIDGSSTLYYKPLKRFLNKYGNDVQKAIKFETVVKVQGINLVKFIQDNTSNDDKIYMKFDIERAEFPVLFSLIKSDVLTRVVAMDVEWHNYNNLFLKVQKLYLKFMLKKKGIKISDWE